MVAHCPACYDIDQAAIIMRPVLAKAHREAQARRFDDTQPITLPGLEVRELGPAEGLREWLDAQAAQERAA